MTASSGDILSADLSSFLKNATQAVVIGVGSEMRGDDAAGIEVVKALRRRLKSPRVLLIEAGVAPENYTSQVRRFKPSHVVLVDATDFNAKPGDVVIAEPGAITGQSISTHTVPLSALCGYLREQTGSEVILVGIQPELSKMGAKMSVPVKFSVNKIVEILLAKLGSI